MQRHVLDAVDVFQYDPSTIKARSKVAVTSDHVFSLQQQNVANGVMSTALGACKQFLCSTCLRNESECFGHTGHIDLPCRVVAPMMMQTVLQVLRCVCFGCGTFRVLDEAKLHALRTHPKLALDMASQRLCVGKAVPCGRCGMLWQPSYASTDGITVQVRWPEKKGAPPSVQGRDQAFTLDHVWAVLSMVADETWDLLGLDVTADSLVTTTLNVSPSSSRPTFVLPNQFKHTHPTTTLYRYIMTAATNIAVLKDMAHYPSLREYVEKRQFLPGTPQAVIEERTRMLAAQLKSNPHATLAYNQADMRAHIDLLGMSNKRTQAQIRTNRAGVSELKGSASDVLNKKTGMLRGQSISNTTNNAFRAVVGSADWRLGIEYVEVPYRVAMTLSHPLPVTDWNVDRLRAMVRVGAGRVGGANHVDLGGEKGGGSGSRSGSSPEDLKNLGRKERDAIASMLKPGCTVWRVLQDGDPLCCIRAPSLHCGNVVMKRAKIAAPPAPLPRHPTDPRQTVILAGKTACSTAQVNLGYSNADTKPQHLDFDGDEMNVHKFVDQQASAGLEHLMTPEGYIMDAATSTPLICPQHNVPIVCWLLTDPTRTLSRELVFQVLMYADKWTPVSVTLPALRERCREVVGMGTATATEVPDLVPAKVLVEVLLPPDFCMTGPKGHDWVIRNGRLREGVRITSKLLDGGGGITHTMVLMYGAARTLRFLNSLVAMTVPLVTLLVPSGGAEQICNGRGALEEAAAVLRAQVREKMAAAVRLTEGLEPEVREDALTRVAQSALGAAEATVEALLPEHHALLDIIKGKGTTSHVAMALVMLGQTFVNEARYGIDKTTRLPLASRSPVFKQSPEGDLAAFGFVDRGLGSTHEFVGLSATQVRSAIAQGRADLVEVGSTTPTTGTIQRYLCLGAEELTVGAETPDGGRLVYFRAVGAEGQRAVVQFHYAATDLDPRWVMHTKVVAAGFGLHEMYDEGVGGDWEWAQAVRAVHVALLKSGPREVAKGMEPDAFPLAFLSQNERERLSAVPVTAADPAVASVQQAQAIVLRELVAPLVDHHPPATVTLWDVEEGVASGRLFPRLPHLLDAMYWFGPGLLAQDRVSARGLVETCRRMARAFQRAKVEVGHNVGVIAGQSIGEGSTQQALDTFHVNNVSVSTMAITMMRELILGNQVPRFIFVTARFKAGVDEADARRVMARVRPKFLAQFQMEQPFLHVGGSGGLAEHEAAALRRAADIGFLNEGGGGGGGSETHAIVFRLFSNRCVRDFVTPQDVAEGLVDQAVLWFREEAVVPSPPPQPEPELASADADAAAADVDTTPPNPAPAPASAQSTPRVFFAETETSWSFMLLPPSGGSVDTPLEVTAAVTGRFVNEEVPLHDGIRQVQSTTVETRRVRQWSRKHCMQKVKPALYAVMRGCSLRDVLMCATLHDYLDMRTLCSSCVSEMQDVFGIEAGQEAWHRTLRDVCLGSMSYAHTTLLADAITWTGRITSLTPPTQMSDDAKGFIRHALVRSALSVFSKASTRKDTKDPLVGLAAELFGVPHKAGTHMVDVFYDEGLAKRLLGMRRNAVGTVYVDGIQRLRFEPKPPPPPKALALTASLGQAAVKVEVEIPRIPARLGLPELDPSAVGLDLRFVGVESFSRVLYPNVDLLPTLNRVKSSLRVTRSMPSSVRVIKAVHDAPCTFIKRLGSSVGEDRAAAAATATATATATACRHYKTPEASGCADVPDDMDDFHKRRLFDRETEEFIRAKARMTTIHNRKAEAGGVPTFQSMAQFDSGYGLSVVPLSRAQECANQSRELVWEPHWAAEPATASTASTASRGNGLETLGGITVDFSVCCASNPRLFPFATDLKASALGKAVDTPLLLQPLHASALTPALAPSTAPEMSVPPAAKLAKPFGCVPRPPPLLTHPFGPPTCQPHGGIKPVTKRQRTITEFF